jgi:ElaB/YqjD/DUF883 family membrane-anchored ribosome-binding protein
MSMSDLSNRPFAGSGNGQPSTPAPSLGDAARSRAENLKDKVGDAFDRGKSGIADSASAARDSLAEDMTRLRADLAKMQETVARFATEAGSEAATTARRVGQVVASEVGSAASGIAEAGAQMASSAKEQVKTFASEFEAMARRNPLGTMAGTLVAGIVIGLMSRSRS